MGCICSKRICKSNFTDEIEKEKESNKRSAPCLSNKGEIILESSVGRADGSLGRLPNPGEPLTNDGLISVQSIKVENNTTLVESVPKSHHQRLVSMGDVGKVEQEPIFRIFTISNGDDTQHTGWPLWLSSVAGEAIKGWVPRQASSFQKLDKIGQGTYSSVYKARDLETGKIVAMKKVRFVNMDPESVRFMAREIYILRKLDHPNVMKLESIVTSRMSNNLYLVFEYMEHDLSGLSSTRGVKFTEPQIKCYMQQVLSGLEHCHSRGVLHRDIKGSNLLIDSGGVLKIADFGLATVFQAGQSEPLTSRVVTLWYRPPELLLGCTKYGVAIDMWSAGCILAELFTGKPIMPGRTEVEQMHKILKLCGSPSEEYWKNKKMPHATSFKPQQPYKRCLAETFKNFPPSAFSLVDKLLAMEPNHRGSATSALESEFFTTSPLPCDPSNIPQYPPSKEFDTKHKDEAKRQKTAAVKGRGPDSVRRGSRDRKVASIPEFNAPGEAWEGQSSPKSSNINYNTSCFPVEKVTMNSGISHSTSMIHPKAVQSSHNNQASYYTNVSCEELQTPNSHIPLPTVELSQSSLTRDEKRYLPTKNRIRYSGPLLPQGSNNIDDMLKEHERQIQEAVRRSRVAKVRTKESYDSCEASELLQHIRSGYIR